MGIAALWAPLTLLLLPSLVAYGGAELQPGAAGQGTAPGTHHHAQAGFLEDLAVVVVGVPHGPAAEVPLRVLLLARVDEPHVAIGPFLEGIEVLGLLQQGRCGAGQNNKEKSKRTLLVYCNLIFVPCYKTCNTEGKKSFFYDQPSSRKRNSERIACSEVLSKRARAV